jgi:lipopolysaccharide assembly outer membrane protein LptD (OstA)
MRKEDPVLRASTVLLLALLPSALCSEETGGQAGQEKQQNRIETVHSEEATVDVEHDEIITRLKGKVELVATQYRVRADYVEGRRDKSGEFKAGFAEGNVRVFLSDTMLKGDRLDYDREGRKAILTCKEGKPKAWKAGKVAEAIRIIYDLTAKDDEDRKRVVFEGDFLASDGAMPKEHAEVFPPKAPEPEKEPGK